MKLKCLAIGLCLIEPTAAKASDWRFVTISAVNSIIYVDRDSVRDNKDYSGTTKIAWFKTNDSQNKTVRYRESKTLYHFKCATSEMKIVQWVEYRADGSVSYSSPPNPFSSFTAAVPDTIGYAMLEAACFPEPEAM